MAEEKIYVGTGKIINTQYGEMTTISFNRDHLNRMLKFMDENKVDWCNTKFLKKQKPDPGKPTHYLEINPWKGTQKVNEPISNDPIKQEQDDYFDCESDIPF